MPKYTGPVPTRESISEDYDFVFIGWDPKIVKVTGDAEYVDENALSVTVKRLRDKLSAQDKIKTVYGIGYSWVKRHE